MLLKRDTGAARKSVKLTPSSPLAVFRFLRLSSCCKTRGSTMVRRHCVGRTAFLAKARMSAHLLVPTPSFWPGLLEFLKELLKVTCELCLRANMSWFEVGHITTQSQQLSQHGWCQAAVQDRTPVFAGPRQACGQGGCNIGQCQCQGFWPVWGQCAYQHCQGWSA